MTTQEEINAAIAGKQSPSWVVTRVIDRLTKRPIPGIKVTYISATTPDWIGFWSWPAETVVITTDKDGDAFFYVSGGHDAGRYGFIPVRIHRDAHIKDPNGRLLRLAFGSPTKEITVSPAQGKFPPDIVEISVFDELTGGDMSFFAPSFPRAPVIIKEIKIGNKIFTDEEVRKFNNKEKIEVNVPKFSAFDITATLVSMEGYRIGTQIYDGWMKGTIKFRVETIGQGGQLISETDASELASSDGYMLAGKTKTVSARMEIGALEKEVRISVVNHIPAHKYDPDDRFLQPEENSDLISGTVIIKPTEAGGVAPTPTTTTAKAKEGLPIFPIILAAGGLALGYGVYKRFIEKKRKIVL